MKKHILAMKWTSRVTGSLIVLLTLMSFVFHPPRFSQFDSRHVFELCAYGVMIAGFIAGWKHEGVSGLLILVGYVVFAGLNGIIYLNWILLLYPAVGAMYVYIWLNTRFRMVADV